MKTNTRGILFLFVAFATSSLYGGQPPVGVAGVDVFVKQNPSKRVVTDARGSFVLDALPAGSYALTFRARKAANVKNTTSDKVMVATTYSVRVEGTKRTVNQSGLTSDVLLGGFEIPVQVAAGAKIRGHVVAGAIKKMVWIPKEPGSNIPGRWVEAGSEAASRSNTVIHSREDMQEIMNRGNANMTDPGGAFDPARSTQTQSSGR